MFVLRITLLVLLLLNQRPSPKTTVISRHAIRQLAREIRAAVANQSDVLLNHQATVLDARRALLSAVYQLRKRNRNA